MHAFTFFGPNPAIAHVVEAIWDIDLPDAGQAPAFTFKVLPSVSSAFCLHYRSPTVTDQWTNSHCLQSVDLLNLLGAVAEKGAGFRSLRDTWADTSTAHGRLMLTVLGGLAEFERDRHSHRVRDLDVFPGFVCTKDTRVSIGNNAYRKHCIYSSQ
jgi:hypothetical protein